MAEKTRSIRPVIIFGFSVIFITFGVFGGWASVAKLDAGVVAPGTILLEGNRKVVQHLEGGIVEEILVKEADIVTVGQPLMRLNSVETRSNLQVLVFRRDLARVIEARLLAERSLKDAFDLPDGLDATALSAGLTASIAD
ncbi:MAG: HlyD family type I secretion periplasmic adaptor subunit, partial [Pseudomonadota bacterium]